MKTLNAFPQLLIALMALTVFKFLVHKHLFVLNVQLDALNVDSLIPLPIASSVQPALKAIIYKMVLNVFSIVQKKIIYLLLENVLSAISLV
jgi:hypothetical protein